MTAHRDRGDGRCLCCALGFHRWCSGGGCSCAYPYHGRPKVIGSSDEQGAYGGTWRGGGPPKSYSKGE